MSTAQWVTYEADLYGGRSPAHLVANQTDTTVLTRCGILIYPWWGRQDADESCKRCCACDRVYTQLKVIQDAAAKS